MSRALNAWDTDVREYLEAGGQPRTHDEKRAALLSILPASVRKDVLMNMHMSEPPQGATPQQQHMAYIAISSKYPEDDGILSAVRFYQQCQT